MGPLNSLRQYCFTRAKQAPPLFSADLALTLRPDSRRLPCCKSLLPHYSQQVHSFFHFVFCTTTPTCTGPLFILLLPIFI